MVTKTLSLDTASEAWQELTQHVGRFLAAWGGTGDPPPEVRDYLPAEPPAMRRMVLVELVKIDLEQRLQVGAARRTLEEYGAEFPELAGGGNLPCDLIYEEYRARQEAGDPVAYEDYVRRFPKQAGALRRLFGFRSTRVVKHPAAGPEAIELKPGQTLDDFEIVSPLGEGAFAKVFLARQKSMQRRVAIKLSSRASDEPQTMAQLDHPNIVRVFDQRHLPEHNLQLVYMEFVGGGSLQVLAEKVRRTPPGMRTGALLCEVVDHCLATLGETPASALWQRQMAQLSWSGTVCWLGAQLASALDYAHRHETLHRDMKPANVLLTAEGVPKLVDFNMSYSSKLEGASPAAFFGGTLGYMSPEHLEAYSPNHERLPEELDGQCDTYGLGVILWELLTGSRPFADEVMEDDWETTLQQMIDRRRAGVPAAAEALLPADIPPGLREVLLRCLAPDPQKRYATAGDMARELSLCLDPAVCQARRKQTGRWYRFGRRFPLTVVTVDALLPNVAVSAINVTYDWFAIVSPRVEPEARLSFITLITVFKALFYAAGLAVGIAYAWPIFAPFRQRVGLDELRRARRAALGLGLMVFWVSVAAWCASGLLFPAWIHYNGGQMPLRDYVHFCVSHWLCGVVAGTFSFFLMSLVASRLLYPALLELGPADAAEAEPLDDFRRRLVFFGRMAVVTPFVAAIALGFGDRDFQGAFAGLAVLGLLALAVAFRLVRDVQSDIDGLAAAVAPDTSRLIASAPALAGSTRPMSSRARR